MENPPTTLDANAMDRLLGRPPTRSPTESTTPPACRRQPIHTVYGGGHLFRSNTAAKLGQIALGSLRKHAPSGADLARILNWDTDSSLADTVYERVVEKLEREPIEDYRIDFEDGYGYRPDAEEDEHAAISAAEVARGMNEGGLPPTIGFRVKSFSSQTRRRGLQTLDVFLTALARSLSPTPRVPAGFVVALPKVSDQEAVESFVKAVEILETECGFESRSINIEIMVETPRSIIAEDGSCALPGFVRAADGRCVAAHFGAYDYTAACDVTAASQSLHHDGCIFARQMMKAALAETGIRLVDGATNLLPIEPLPPEAPPDEAPTGRSADAPAVPGPGDDAQPNPVHQAWRASSGNIRQSLAAGFYQGWDLHPAQLPIRYAATYRFFLESLDEASTRLRQFVDQAAQATRLGGVFDDAATGQGLLNFFRRGLDCGAIAEDQLEATGLTREEVAQRSFMEICRSRQ